MTSLEKGLREFARFSAKLKGDEKSEAQTFLFHLLATFGHDANTLPKGSTFECRVRSPRPSDERGVRPRQAPPCLTFDGTSDFGFGRQNVLPACI